MGKQFLGKGWASKYGVKIAIKKDEISKLPTDKFGYVRLEVNTPKVPFANDESKSTHYVAVDDFAYERMKGELGDKNKVDTIKVPATDKPEEGWPF